MLAATARVVQVLDTFEIRVVISVFNAGMEPEQFASQVLTVKLDDELERADPLTITRSLLALWSEVTSSPS